MSSSKPPLPYNMREVVLPGDAACPGCPIPIAWKVLSAVFGNKMILTIPACCSAVVVGIYPGSSLNTSLVHVAFASAAAVASGLAEGLRRRGVKDVAVIAWAGDGGTGDIGMASLSGAAERNHDFIYIMYDNEAYMNTGIQRSGTTPFGAWTTTTPVGARWKGKREFSKNMIDIMIAHRISYIATLSLAFVKDFETKFKKAMNVVDNNIGMAYLHVHQPCPTGWRFDSSKTVEVARLAVLTGIWPLIEVENGVFKLTFKPAKLRPVVDYLKLQGRFAHLTEEQIKSIQEFVEKNWQRLLELDGKKLW